MKHLLFDLVLLLLVALGWIPSAAIGALTTTADAAHNLVDSTLSLSPVTSASWYVEFEEWLILHAKSYETVEEWNLRQGIFAQNTVLVAQHNAAYEAGLTTFQMTMTSPFADLTDDEFTQLHLMEAQHCHATTNRNQQSQPSLQSIAEFLSRSRPSKFHTTELPKSAEITISSDYHVDWRTKGVVTPIKDQGNCGSCWTFSTTGCLESHLCLSHDELHCPDWTGLSEQQLVDCAGAYNNFGCDGGLPSQAFEYIKFNGYGLDVEASYPYTGVDTGYCLFHNHTMTNQPDEDESNNKAHMMMMMNDDIIGGQILEVYNISKRAEGDLEYAIAHIGPVSIAYQVAPDFRFYAHGVYDSFNATATGKVNCQSEPEDVNHAVVAVGLGSTTSTTNKNGRKEDDPDIIPYYIVRNSWGTSWGMEGYFWMKRGENLCGVSDCASFPLVVPPHVSSTLASMKTTAGSSQTQASLRRRNSAKSTLE